MKSGFLERSFIESLLKNDSIEHFVEIQSKVLEVCSMAIEKISRQIPFINIENSIFQPVNETFNLALTPTSEYKYFLGLQSPQIEINCTNGSDFFKNFKQRWIQAWQDSKKKRKRKKKNEKIENEVKYNEFNPDKYNLENFCRDFQLALCENLSETTIVYNTGKSIIIQGRDDFDFLAKIVIIPVIFRDDKFNYFINKKQGFITIDMNERLKNFNEKLDIVGDCFVDVVKLFNSLFKSVTKESINQIFIESLLYNVPNEFFVDDIYNSFIKILNYFNTTDISSFKSINNLEVSIFKNPLIKNAGYQFNKFLKNFK